MKFDIMTLFPEMVERITGESILGRAQENHLITVRCHNIRDYSENRHHNVDDTPYGGGMGMVMAAPPIWNCHQAILAQVGADERCRTVYLSPRGRRFDQGVAQEYTAYDRLILLCGHYEGVDERAIRLVADEELSVGDYVLTGGELPACIVVDAVSRLLPGVLSDPACHREESIASGLLEYPQYTRPPCFMGMEVPEVLLSGHHAHIADWRLQQSLELTRNMRPDLYEAYLAAHPAEPPRKKRRRTSSEPGS